MTKSLDQFLSYEFFRKGSNFAEELLLLENAHVDNL